MKNKKVNYILIPAVTIIWVLIFYKIISTVKHTQSNVKQNFSVALVDSASGEFDSFKLVANYRDPFKDSPHEELNSLPARKPAATQKNIEISWPNLQYLGLIKNKNNKYLAILKVNGKSQMLAKNDTIKGIKLLDIKPDSILVSFHREKKVIKK